MPDYKLSINLKIGFLSSIFFIVCASAFPQIDTLILNNNNIIVGEIKSMDRGVIQIETDYSDSDFKIEWEKISSINTESHFFVTLEDGTKYFNTTLSSVNDSMVIVYIDPDQAISCQISKIVYLSSYKDRFLDRLSANIDVGFSLTAAKNLQQFTINSRIAYLAEKWSTDISFNSIRSTQDETDPIERTEGEYNLRYVLPRRFYAIATASLLSDTEQKLELRSNTQLGLGNFIIRTNRSYWGTKLGVNRNIERYSSETEDRNSWEGYFGTELNLFDVGDFSLLTIIMAYPSFTEKGRWRLDSNLDIKYDLPFDFYIKLGGSFNFDSQPAQGASELGYVLQTGIGWEW
jgi:hypothetical protein